MALKHAFTGLALAFSLCTAAGAGDDPHPYATPEDALDSLMTALAANDAAALLDIFGSKAEDLLRTGNPLRDAENRATLRALYAEGYRLRPDGADTRALLLGTDAWQFPLPLTRSEAGWIFDVEEGRTEVLARRIGLNELGAMEMMYAYVDAQAAFRQIDHDSDGVMEFAAGILPSAPDARDGLFWQGPDSIMGELIALASLDGYNDGTDDQAPEPFGGYYYRVLGGQGPDAPGGEMTYTIGGHKVAGHALLAVPSDYGNSGIFSFLIAENGILYEADLGEDSLDAALAMTRYNPASPWEKVSD